MARHRKIPLAAKWRVDHRRWNGGWGLREVARVGHWEEDERVGGRAAQEAEWMVCSRGEELGRHPGGSPELWP